MFLPFQGFLLQRKANNESIPLPEVPRLIVSRQPISADPRPGTRPTLPRPEMNGHSGATSSPVGRGGTWLGSHATHSPGKMLRHFQEHQNCFYAGGYRICCLAQNSCVGNMPGACLRPPWVLLTADLCPSTASDTQPSAREQLLT